jgi:hypothetical protein
MMHMGDTARTDGVPAVLSDWRFLAALIVLIINDQILKASYPSWVTGKLSDFAGMVVFPVVLAGLVGLLAPRLAGRHRERIRQLSLALSGVTLVVIKTIAAGAQAMESLLEGATGASQQIVVDQTDLLGLAGLLVANSVLKCTQPAHLASKARVAVWAVAAIACVATSQDSPYASNWNHIELNGDQIVVTGDQAAFGWVSVDDGLTWSKDSELESDDFYDPPPVNAEPVSICPDTAEAVCIELSGHTIRESKDGGQTWETVWSIDPTEPWVKSFGFSIRRDVIIAPGHLVVTDKGSIIAAMGGIEPLRRAPDGTWTPSVASLRELPSGMPFASAAIALCCFAAFTLARKRWVGLAFPAAALGLLIGSLALFELNRSAASPGGFGALIWVAFVLGAVALYAVIWLVREGTRSKPKLPVYRYGWAWTDAIPAVAGAVLVWVPLAVWATGRDSWTTANAATVLIGLGSIGMTFLLIQRSPIQPVQIEMPAMPPPPFSSPPPPPSEPAFFSTQPVQIPIPILYRRPLATFTALGVIGVLVPYGLAMIPFALQGVLLNKAGWRLPPWWLRFVVANLVIPVTWKFSPQRYIFGDVRPDGFQYWSVEVLEALLIAAIYLAGPWSRHLADDEIRGRQNQEQR